ncbi:DUF4293 domain-containing protein [Tenuifilum osseticum]|uniref:DUF4293 domain-containing protein n=1 Tax=Tenuifilum osseticum TaxID=3374723 RepID=UPI0034E49AF0
MIQRIQSLFLLASVILLSILMYNPFASFIVEPQMAKYTLGVFGLSVVDGSTVEKVQSIWFLLGFIIAVLLISFVTIFLYHRRLLQIRLCVLTIVMLVGLQGVMYYVVYAYGENLNSKPSYNLVFIFPLIAAILNFLALRAIARDEALIRSLDRLR